MTPTMIPECEHRAKPWRIHEIIPDFDIEDVWALPATGDADDFADVVDMMRTLEFPESGSLAARFLWWVRDQMGRWFALGRIGIPAQEPAEFPIYGTDEHSLAGRLPDDLRGTAPAPGLPRTRNLAGLYLTDTEYASEISNRTMHGVMHLGWADQGEERYQLQMAVYVKPRGWFGEAYMALIKPFRYIIVYPSLMRVIEREWQRRPRGHA